MQIRRSTRIPALLGASLAAATALTLAVSGPASAANSADTTVTFTVSGSTIDITVPATASLGTVAPGASATALLGPVTVTDSRAALASAWTATVTSTAFTSPPPPATATQTIPIANVSYWSGAATATTGSGAFTPGQPAVGNAVVLDGPATAFTHASGSGNNSAVWNPTLIVAVPASAVGGVYTGTVTHSVA